MKLEQETEQKRSSLKKYFYVNRTNYKVTVDPEDKSVRKVWGNALSQIVKSPSAENSVADKGNI